MRMWLIDPRFLCRKHLLGEHNELHKFAADFFGPRPKDTRKRTVLGQVFPRSMRYRHDALAGEIQRRGYRHRSPYDHDCSKLPEGDVSCDRRWRNMIELGLRCQECCLRMQFPWSAE